MINLLQPHILKICTGPDDRIIKINNCIPFARTVDVRLARPSSPSEGAGTQTSISLWDCPIVAWKASVRNYRHLPYIYI